MAGVAIQDGFNLRGELPGQPGLFPPVRFTYRVARGGQGVFRWEATRWQEREAVAAEIVAAHLIDMECQGDDGEWTPVTANAETMRKWHSPILVGVLNHILGYLSPVLAESLPKSPAPSPS